MSEKSDHANVAIGPTKMILDGSEVWHRNLSDGALGFAKNIWT